MCFEVKRKNKAFAAQHARWRASRFKGPISFAIFSDARFNKD